MRNLKKFLALMLAMVMAMSLMITANATSTAEDFADGAGITPEFAEAVDVLSGMRVFSGDNGNFKPAANITRAEMAAVLYRLVSGDVTDAKAGLYANYAPFKDVTADKWYAGYVGYCWNAGLIKGRDAANTIFDPTGNVTGYEALTMLLRAIGYDKNNEFTGPNWQVNVSSQSRDLGILRDVNTTQYGGTLHLAARRDVIASLTFNAAARVPTVTFNGTTYNPYVGVPVTGAGSQPEHNPTLGWKSFGLMSDTGIVVGNQDTGESVTRMSFSLITADPVYAYGTEDESGDAFVKADALDANGKPVTGKQQNNAIATFDAKTGLDLFAHKVEIWFDGRNTELKPAYFGQDVALDWRNSKQNNNLHTYAYFDRATLTDVVKLDNSDNNKASADNRYSVADEPDYVGVLATGEVNQNLKSLARAAGFAVSGGTRVEQNYGFNRFLPIPGNTSANPADADADLTAPPAADADTDNIKVSEIGADFRAPNGDDDNVDADFSENLYLLISNSSNKSLDVVIALNIQVSEITGVDNVNAIKTVTVPQETTNPVFVSANNELTHDGAANPATLEQGQLVPGSTTTLGQKEIGVRINGTSDFYTDRLPNSDGVVEGTKTALEAATGYDPSYSTLDETAWYKLLAVNNYKDGVVVSYNPDTGKVNLQDGTVLDRSILYDSVVANTIPQVGGNENGLPGSNDYYQSGTYRFYLTPDGKYLGAELVYSNTFIYGTYFDYSTVTSSSKFEYFLTGVNLAGEKVTVPVSFLNNVLNPVNGTDQLGVPFRDTQGVTSNVNSVNGIGNGAYRGFAYNGTNLVDWNFTDLAQIGVISGDNSTVNKTWNGTAGDDPADWGPTANGSAPSVTFDNDDYDIRLTDGTDSDLNAINIGSRQMSLGAVYAGTLDMDGADGGNAADLLYFTEDTKFILVEGFGTDSLTPTVYNGITALATANGHSSVRIRLTGDEAKADDRDCEWANRKDNDLELSNMTYLTQEPFVYSQNRVLSRQAKVIILPAEAVKWNDDTAIRYVGNNARTLVNVGANATQFTMYKDGVAENIWVDGMITQADSSAKTITDNGYDHFYRLTKTSRSIGGEPVYTVAVINLGWTQNIYTASTMNAQTGSFRCTIAGNDRAVDSISLMRVANANITNLNVQYPAPTWPGINSVATLNDAGSLGDYTPNGGGGQHGGKTPLYVSAVVDGSTNVTHIYICYDQNPTP